MPGFARLPDVRQIRQICAPYPGNGDSGGILIVDQLARAWGRDGNDQTGWTIWFEMECWRASARPPTGRSPAPRAAGQSRHTPSYSTVTGYGIYVASVACHKRIWLIKP